jgi:membrane protease YdiL (CAAX protease family)
MSSNRTGDVIAHPPGKGWLSFLRRLSLVRLVVFFGVLLAGDIAAQLGRVWAIRHAPPGRTDWASLGAALLLAAVLVGVYAALVRSIELRAARELAPRPIQGLAGIMLGLALFSSVFGLLRLIGVAQWQGISAIFDVAPALAASIVAAVGEELAFRGALFRILEERFGTTTALAVSAALFGLLHALNPGATAVSTLAIALEAGVLLGAAYAVTRNLWFPIGLHLGWNFTEGGIFGVSVSGGAAAKGIFSVSLSGRTLLTGGNFGPEASLIAIVVCLTAAVVLLVLLLRSGGWTRMQRLPSGA